MARAIRICGVFSVFMAAIVATVGRSALAQDVHPPNGLELATVIVTVSSHHDAAGQGPDVIMDRDRAIGFTAGNCDVVTTFDVVLSYERWSYRSDVKVDIDVVVAGQHYEGKLRPLGVYPMDINLACIDLSPRSPKDRLTIFPLAVEASQLTVPPYDGVTAATDFGTPLLNKNGRVVAVVMNDRVVVVDGRPARIPEFILGSELQHFLDEARTVPRSGQRLFPPILNSARR